MRARGARGGVMELGKFWNVDRVNGALFFLPFIVYSVFG